MWAATMANWEPYAAYRFSESALRGGNPSWRQCLYRLPIKKGFIYGEKSLPDKDWEELESRGIHLEIVAGPVILWHGKIQMGWQWQLQIA